MNNETEQIFLLNPSESQQPTTSQKSVETPLPSQDVEDFSTMCRTCATVTEFVIPIFEGEGLQNNLAEKIHKHLPIQVSETDVLPRVVCYQCASTLLAWHELVQCCEQADAALRARLCAPPPPPPPAPPQEPEPISKEVVQDSDQDQHNKFKEIAEFVVQTLEPPSYPGSQRACAYCAALISDAGYREHLVAAHSDLLFHCDECDTYVDRKDFVLHMSLHAVEYAAKQERKEPGCDLKREKKGRKRKQTRDENENESGGGARRRSAERDGGPGETAGSGDDGARENEFSDHSDAEYGFGPLPESVFEAIEDSQDGRPAETPAASPAGGPTPPEGGPAAGRPADGGPPAAGGKRDHRKPRTCPICGKAYRASSSYFYHMKHFHRRSKEHECDACGKRFGTRAGLAEHRTVHSGEHRHACRECGKRFRSRAGLYIHEQTHSGAKRWACPQCARSFRWRAHLARHALRHAGARAHGCGACGRAFAVRADLLRHARTHAARALACPHCPLHFAQLRYLKVHVRRKHPAAPAPDLTGV